MNRHNIFVFPGSFDPPTIGHVDIIERAASLCDVLYVCVLQNADKKQSLLSTDERVSLLKQITADNDNIIATSYCGMLVDFCKENECTGIIKGVRASGDFEYEKRMAIINKELSEQNIETLLLPASPQLSHISSSMVRELLSYNKDIDSFVPTPVARYLKGDIK